MKRFALIGAAGYVAPRHMRAIKETGNELVAAFDVFDSVGVIDSYFPSADFFTEFERFDRHIDLRRRRGEGVDIVSICSPNYLHDAHVRFALRSGADAICEKPLVLNPWNIDGLAEMERETGRSAHTILQLRLHPTIVELRERIQRADPKTHYDVDLTYITSRGRWYFVSWKGDERKSGGIATNIGVHFFDMLHFLFGDLKENVLNYYSPAIAGGRLEYDRASVRWFLSCDSRCLPEAATSAGLTTYRSITVDGDELEFSGGFTDLHIQSYQEILAGRGFSLEENRCAIETVADIRRMDAVGLKGNYHPLLAKIPD
jgi:UDP-N-acetyl-2-amino-2-deoxyglucuronate dehydrogenase